MVNDLSSYNVQMVRFSTVLVLVAIMGCYVSYVVQNVDAFINEPEKNVIGDNENNMKVDSLTYEGQFGFKQELRDISQNISLSEFWKNLEISGGVPTSKAFSLSTYDGITWDTTYQRIMFQHNAFVTIHSSRDDITKIRVENASTMIEYLNVDGLTKDYNYKYDETVISITELLITEGNDHAAVDKLYQCLSTNGWCFVEYPDKNQDLIQAILGKMKSFMKHERSSFYNDEFYTSLYTKTMLHILTGNMFDLYREFYPLPLLKDLEIFSNTVDRLSMGIMRALYDQIFGLNTLNGGMLDFVLYHNDDEDEDDDEDQEDAEEDEEDEDDDDDEEEEEDMMGKNRLYVREHTDPGLFSISFGSDNLGLQMFDISQSKWINVPTNYGVLWCGEIASKITQNKIKSGIHRVVKNIYNKQPRFTAWYEVCVNNQIPAWLY
eukprot:907390_1